MCPCIRDHSYKVFAILLAIMRILVTGGAGFIGSHFIKYLLRTYPGDTIFNFDKLTYAGNPANLQEIKDNPRYQFFKGDICDAHAVRQAFEQFKPEILVNFAAESHVDRSILEPESFVKTDVMGVLMLAEAARKYGLKRFVHISTDEVYGQTLSGEFREGDALDPRSPYAASKAGGELLARAYFTTYKLPVVITRGANAYGPNQYPEKFIPLAITNVLENRKIPLYGDGLQIRDWTHVSDHVSAIDTVMRKGAPGEIYHFGASQDERTNLDVAKIIVGELGKSEDAVEYVKDRPGHDRRYRLNCDKIRNLGWSPSVAFAQGLRDTIAWYKENEHWWKPLKSGEYLTYYKTQYGKQ